MSGLVWLALALAIVIGSWQMDRLEHLKVSLYTAPGLVPGLLGLALAIMALLLILRSLRAGALSEAKLPSFSLREHWRLLIALALCLIFALGLLGSGLPFWLAAAIFISDHSCSCSSSKTASGRLAVEGRGAFRGVRADLRRRDPLTCSRTCSWSGCP